MANNIIRRVWNQNRMVNIEDLTGAAFQAESGGHTFEISGIDDTGAAVALSGTVAGVFRRPDNADIALTGSASDGVVSVTLSEDCYAVPGRFGLTIFVTSNSQKVAVYACVGTVAVSSTGNVAGDTPQDVVDLINAIEAAVATIPADYTDLMAAIAPAYSSSALYAVGSYAWYDGDLYRCTTAITTAETWTAGHWTAAVLGDDVGDLKSALSEINHDLYGIEIVTPTVAEGRGVYYGGSTASIVSAPRTSVFFPVTVGLTYSIKTNGEVFRIGFATDSDITAESVGNYLFDYQNLDGETDYTFAVSNSNYTFCYITYKYQENTTATIEIKQSGIGLKDIVTEHTSEIGAIVEQIKPKETIIAQNSYIDYRNGRVIGNYPGLNVTELKVAGGMAVVYDYIYSAPDIRGLAFYDLYDRYISGTQVSTQSQTINVPGNACICRATVDAVGRVKLLYLSDSVGIINEQIRSSALKTFGNPLDKITDETGLLDLFLNVGCIGDSLASGESYYNEGGTPHGIDLYQYSWGQFLARKTGNTYYNFSAGGLSSRSWLASEYAAQCFDGNHNCQAYIIGLGQNDANADIPIGTSADIKADYSENPDTFYGNYGKIIQKIKEIVPKAKIFVITDMNASTNSKGYNTAIRDMADIFENVYVLDFREYGLKYYNLPIVSGQMRNSHYNAFGYKLFSMMIANYINWVMVNHYDEFTQVEFIDSTHSWIE